MTESACLQASTNALPIRCDDAQDCNPDGGNAVCCVTADSTSGLATDVACAAKSNCQSQSSQNYLCDPHVPNACDNGDECLPSLTALPGYTLCRTP
jgi:hypothetical protein